MKRLKQTSKIICQSLIQHISFSKCNYSCSHICYINNISHVFGYIYINVCVCVCVLQLLIGYETGQIVLWDLKTKTADYRWQSDEPLRSISWHHEGKQFMACHTDGSLTTWFSKQPKPANITHPHGKVIYIF